MMDARLKRIKELFSESEKRNGELSHENFELKKRIAELEEIGIVHCGECIHRREFEEYNRTHNSFDLCVDCEIDGKYHDDDWFCADGERKGAK